MEEKKNRTFRLKATTIELVKQEAADAKMSINNYADQKLSKPKKSNTKK